MSYTLSLKKGTTKVDLILIFLGFCFCLFPIFVLIVPTYTQSACETVKEGYLIYYEREKTPAYLEDSNINSLKALEKNCMDIKFN